MEVVIVLKVRTPTDQYDPCHLTRDQPLTISRVVVKALSCLITNPLAPEVGIVPTHTEGETAIEEARGLLTTQVSIIVIVLGFPTRRRLRGWPLGSVSYVAMTLVEIAPLKRPLNPRERNHLALLRLILNLLYLRIKGMPP